MGKIYVDSLEKPESGVVMLGDFCFLSGKPKSEIISGALTNSASEEVILVPQNDDWAQMIVECYGEKAEKAIRYAIKKEPGIFDLETLLKVTEKLQKEHWLCPFLLFINHIHPPYVNQARDLCLSPSLYESDPLCNQKGTWNL